MDSPFSLIDEATQGKILVYVKNHPAFWPLVAAGGVIYSWRYWIELWKSFDPERRKLSHEKQTLEHEKQTLELLKLRYEIEAIKKQHGLSLLSGDPAFATEIAAQPQLLGNLATRLGPSKRIAPSSGLPPLDLGKLLDGLQVPSDTQGGNPAAGLKAASEPVRGFKAAPESARELARNVALSASMEATPVFGWPAVVSLVLQFAIFAWRTPPGATSSPASFLLFPLESYALGLLAATASALFSVGRSPGAAPGKIEGALDAFHAVSARLTALEVFIAPIVGALYALLK